MKTQTMTGKVTSISDGEYRASLVITGNDGRLYVVGYVTEYIDIDQRLRSPSPDAKELDYAGHRWLGRTVEFEYVEVGDRLLIMDWIRFGPKMA